eukprot:2545874-Prorocentrum_lima.AAC.1
MRRTPPLKQPNYRHKRQLRRRTDKPASNSGAPPPNTAFRPQWARQPASKGHRQATHPPPL